MSHNQNNEFEELNKIELNDDRLWQKVPSHLREYANENLLIKIRVSLIL
jgi:hypothetical protein